ncbi:hypothetical protein FHT39_000518 [Mitsuaria sp. BK045]|uniref:AIPR family protein n=1 Tax=unclassified Roseateles TaxID=2626991 RepID=UPI00160F17AD|nr:MULTISPECIES: AIPR family protein [unclassified Roseateles]MBB3291879.1 hypothetical protein [Mitsuaria sp. BK041]MBB3361096.1 hypothetical protein [Mitsuaria sp. BK045]
MDDGQFLDELKGMVRRRAAASHLVDTLAFAQEVGDRLEGEPAFGELIPLEYSGSGRRGRAFRIHGYTRLDESDGSIGLVIGSWSDQAEVELFPAEDVDLLTGMLETFTREAIEGDLVELMPEANSAFELALLLRDGRSAISRIRLHVLANRRLSQRFKERVLPPIGGVPVEQHVWDFSRLKDIYGSSREREAIEISLSDFDSLGFPFLEAVRQQDLRSYLCVVDAETLSKMFERFGSRLLEGNVRSFLGMKGGVNKGIRRTVQTAPELFFAFNNGIAATASAVAIQTDGGVGRIVGLTDLQIVNGGQTTASLLSVRKKEGVTIREVSVAMKLTVVAPDRANELIPRIAEYANTQNKIAAADFFANHPFHRKMEEISRRLSVASLVDPRARSKWFYERARGQYQNERLYLPDGKRRLFDLEFPPIQVINKTELAKYDGVLNCRPHQISFGAQKNFLKFAAAFEPPTSDIPPLEYWESIESSYSDEYYRRIVVCALLWRSAESVVARGKADWYEGDYRPQLVAYALSMIIHALRGAGEELDFASLWNAQSIPHDLEVLIRSVAIEAQQVILNPPLGMKNVGEWAKKEQCWDRARVRRFEVPSQASWLTSAEVNRRRAMDAKREGVRDQEIALQQMVLEKVQSGYWASLAKWPRLRDFATDQQLALVLKCATVTGFSRINTERDWKRLIETGRIAEDEGFVHRPGN